MPEHREGTPEQFRILESFLWHDFGAEPSGWTGWSRRLMPDLLETDVLGAYETGLHLHRALRAMQAGNSGLEEERPHSGQATLNGLITSLHIQPRVDGSGQVFLVALDQSNPAARLLVSALEAMRLGVWSRFKLCREPSCRASYYDTSKAAVKVWCSMETCGSRNKMQRYRTRHMNT